MKYLYYVLIAIAIYLAFCAFSDVLSLRPFSAIFELALAGLAGYSAIKLKRE